MSVAIAFTCTNATESKGGGFDTGGKLSGTAEVELNNVPGTATSATYSLACTNGSVGTSTQCTVQISRPKISLTANPEIVQPGGIALIGWTTGGMASCVVSSPDDEDFTERNANSTSTTGVATSSPLYEPARFALACTTLGGAQRVATTSVAVAAATSTSAFVTSALDGRVGVQYGETAQVSWGFASSFTNTAVAFWLYDASAARIVALMGSVASTTGSLPWTLPRADDACPQDSPFVCPRHLVSGRSYGIVAELYRPANAYLGGPVRPDAPSKETLEYVFTPEPFRFGQ